MTIEREYFRGDYDEYWPRGVVYLDTGYVDPEYYKILLSVGSCSMEITPEVATEILIAVSAANRKRRELCGES